MLGLLFGLIEVLSQTRFPGQLGLFLTVVGLVVAWLGERRTAKVWPALVLLFFALPQPAALQVALTAGLQLVSSIGAVAIIQMFGIPVLREGNIIDLGQIQLQVAEACAGLRYLFPLATFAFLCAYLYVGHPVKKAVIFLSSVPITVLMNIVRIAVTGLLVEQYGVGAAEGFFHYFEGWIVFCLCLALLFLEMKLLCYVGPGDRSLLRRLDLDPPTTGGAASPNLGRRTGRPGAGGGGAVRRGDPGAGRDRRARDDRCRSAPRSPCSRARSRAGRAPTCRSRRRRWPRSTPPIISA